jgi:hypothetical protein
MIGCPSVATADVDFIHAVQCRAKIPDHHLDRLEIDIRACHFYFQRLRFLVHFKNPYTHTVITQVSQCARQIEHTGIVGLEHIQQDSRYNRHISPSVLVIRTWV